MQTLSKPNFQSHLRVLWMIAVKDWLYFWRYPLNVVALTFQPLIWLVPVFFMGQAFSVNGQARGFAAYTGSTDYISFILLGTVLGNFVNAVFWGMGFSMKNDMDAGTLESNWIMPVPRPLLLVGRTIVSLATTTLTSTVMLALAGWIFGFRANGSTLQALLLALPMLVGLYGFGFAFAALVLIVREANTMVDVSAFLVQGFSGTDFPVTVLPKWLLPVSLVLPLTYGLDAVRGKLLGTHTLLPIQTEAGILIVFMFLMVWLGLVAFRRLERRVRQLGTLGQH
jgi:ABC-2 type transport system permease protein